MGRRATSTDPAHVRKRVRTRANATARDLHILAESYGRQVPVEEWDLEELARGRPRNADGTFIGRVPKYITPIVVAEAKRRLMIQGMAGVHVMLGDAITVVHKIMMSTERDENGRPIVDAKTRLDAAKWIIEHVIGKPKVRVETSDGTDTWRGMLADSLVVVDDNGKAIDAHPVYDASDDEWTDADDNA